MSYKKIKIIRKSFQKNLAEYENMQKRSKTPLTIGDAIYYLNNGLRIFCFPIKHLKSGRNNGKYLFMTDEFLEYLESIAKPLTPPNGIAKISQMLESCRFELVNF